MLEYGVEIGKYKITVGSLLAAAVILLLAKAVIWSATRVLRKYFERKKVDIGRQLAIQQFLNYVIWALSVFVILEMMGIGSVIWASSAALLVGVGLGLQDTFKDLISGIVILMEGTIEVNDVIEVDGMAALVTSIGLRTSKVETRDRVSILIPNSKLVVEKVINWSHNDSPTRFNIQVGVAYGSDLSLVARLLLEAAQSHPKVLADPPVSVQFRDFGDSALVFDLLFFSEEFFRAEVVKSDIRLKIDQFFRQNGVSIPFPQRDIWIRNTAQPDAQTIINH